MSDEILASIQRKTRESNQASLFDIEPDWRESWWGMPEFTMQNASPQHRITINFMTQEDVAEFARITGLRVTTTKDSIWFPEQGRMKPREVVWKGSPSPCKYPVYIPSKGRSDCATTPELLKQRGISFFLVVEPQEADQYKKAFGDCVLVLPFSNLGLGSIPARNWIWQHALENGHDYHWILDDNILGFWRCHANRRIVVDESSAPLRVVESFVDRHENIAFAGLSADGFCPDRNVIAPFTLNTRVYSVTLINSKLPHRWRGKYNEDTDICLRALKDGWSTVLFRSMLMKKAHTASGSGEGGMKGGNTENVYNGGDHRLAFAQSLADQHPDCVKVTWKFNRWHHEVDYSKFKGNKPILKPGIVPRVGPDEYGMKLVRTKEKGQSQ